MINVLLVDDHELVRAGIRRILEDIKGIKVAGEACCGEDAVKWCRANSADVVLMDMNMPGIGGLEATRKIARMFVDTKVIMLTVHTENPLPARVMQAGAAGYRYRYRMFSKLNIHGDVELTHLAIRHGLCNAESLISQ
ncbi:response regulator [Enterobacter hormaechei]|uniref:response regulator n=1 Tax=Enterobacter hormaechei TaxID=158836 RepID=UPI0018C25116|nr:response regulator [Enterobacter hormaechei]MBG0539462.1 response regulator [Enterobacter hormaechei]